MLGSLADCSDRCSLAKGSLCLLLSLILVNCLLDSRCIFALQIKDFLSQMCILAGIDEPEHGKILFGYGLEVGHISELCQA